MNNACGSFGSLDRVIVLHLLEVAMETVHELGVLDGMDDEGLGKVATREEVGGFYDLIGVRDEELTSLCGGEREGGRESER